MELSTGACKVRSAYVDTPLGEIITRGSDLPDFN